MSRNIDAYIVPRTGQRPLRFTGTSVAQHHADLGVGGRVWVRIYRNSRRQFVCATSRMPVLVGDREEHESTVVSRILDVVKFFGVTRSYLALYLAAWWHVLADFLGRLPASSPNEECLEHAAYWLSSDKPREAA